jgi:hypothetical protein
LKKQRDILLKDFRQKLHDDDITKLVLMQRQDNHQVRIQQLTMNITIECNVRLSVKNLFASQMKKYDELIHIIKQNCRAQENLIQAVTDLNDDLVNVRPDMISTFERYRTYV